MLAGVEGAGTWQVDSGGGYIYYFKTLIWGLGWGLLLLSTAGIVTAFIRHDPIDLIILSLPVLLFVYLGRQHLYFGRFMLPLIPAMLILASSFLEKFVVSIFTTASSQRLAFILFAIIIGGQPLITAIRFDMLISRVDTRTLAKQWIEENIPEDTGIAMDWPYHCAPLSTVEKPLAEANRNYKVWVSDFGFGEGLFEHPLEWYTENGYDFLVACSFIYQIPLIDENKNTLRNAYYESLEQNLVLIKEFRPVDGGKDPDFIFDEIYGPAISLWQRERPGPTLRIYQIH